MSANGSDELSALREQRRIALQQQLEEQAKVQADAEMETQRQQLESQSINKAMKQLLTSEARSRITRISLATPERAESIKKLILSMHESNQFTTPMTDETLKSVLLKMQSKSRSNASIRRI
jgi:programmed cell death protein 5|tara:strand:+ start:145 stop:507 length:363 start_codon:yes stop_codon:yes gene_type:complete